MSKRAVLITVVSLALVLVSGWALRRAWRDQETVTPRRGEIVDAIYALGKVKTRRQYEVKIAILDTVTRLFVREGDSVTQGAPLMKLSETSIFKAPFDGVVTSVNIDEGEAAAPQTPLLRLEDLSEKFVEVSLEQQGALRVRKGQLATIIFESVRGEKLTGQVTSIFSKNDEFLAQIDVPGLKDNVLPGMTADVAISIARNPNALLIPLSSVNNGHVIALRDGKRKKLPVTIGAIDGQWAEVTGGELLENDQLVVAPGNGASSGAK